MHLHTHRQEHLHVITRVAVGLDVVVCTLILLDCQIRSIGVH